MNIPMSPRSLIVLFLAAFGLRIVLVLAVAGVLACRLRLLPGAWWILVSVFAAFLVCGALKIRQRKVGVDPSSRV